MINITFEQKINNLKLSIKDNKYKSEICGLLDEILNSKDKIKTDSEIEAINFAINYLEKEKDLYPDNLEFGLLDDYIVLKYITYKIIYKYDDSICFAAINNFLDAEQMKILIQLSEIEYKFHSDMEDELNIKIENLKKIDTKLLTELLQIVAFLKNILLLNVGELNKIANWALIYFLCEDDIINDTADFGYIDDFLILKSAEISIKEQLYKEYPKHFVLLSKYEKYFLPLYFKIEDKPVHLNDFQKIISMYFFEKAINEQKDDFGIVLPEQSSFTKTLIYFFYQIGLLSKSYFDRGSKNDIIERLKKKERILYRISSKEQFLFVEQNGDRYEFIKKENKQGRKTKESPDKLILLIKNIFDSNNYEIIPLTSSGNKSNEVQHDFIKNYLRLIMANYFECALSEIELTDTVPEKILFSPIGRIYNIYNYNQLRINDLSLNKILPSHFD